MDKAEDSLTKATTQATQILNNSNPKRTKRERKMVLILSNVGSGTKQDTCQWNAEKENP